LPTAVHGKPDAKDEKSVEIFHDYNILYNEKFYPRVMSAQTHPLWNSTEANGYQYGL
jgi:hypothetical protein